MCAPAVNEAMLRASNKRIWRARGESRALRPRARRRRKLSRVTPPPHWYRLPANAARNRYVDVLAYDHSRVMLGSSLGKRKARANDYVNANFVDGYDQVKAYISTQG